ncbi:ABSCISIC ACID-INSENSITIVE 5-like protein 3 isoform X2 [Miscanthus floridulus]|uniref:ABSCISIC ACID-INSENSITIVE 5-like protein 3 isoform X2 n=1 Tax=Miscanthus floridulus TaxID=154761 RepID=UPI0034592196
MGVQTMSSHSHGDDGRRGLPRQGSVYGLTLTEVETQLGEPLRTMNLDDLLRTVLPAAAGQPPAVKKTVGEVWRDIQSAGGGGRQPSMGEMTLEDFLSRAGVAVDAAPHWMHQYPPQQQYALPRPLPLGAAAPGPAAAYCDRPVGVFLSHSHSHSQVAGRKRGAAAAGDGDGVVERTVERRQKRMIKNRESAARSRARKQAYTNELENKIARLEEENERLRKLKPDETKKMEPNEEHVHSLDSSIHPQFHSKNAGTTGATTGAGRAAAIAATGEEAAATPPPPPANEFCQFLMRRPWAGRPYMFIVKLSRASN